MPTASLNYGHINAYTEKLQLFDAGFQDILEKKDQNSEPLLFLLLISKILEPEGSVVRDRYESVNLG